MSPLSNPKQPLLHKSKLYLYIVHALIVRYLRASLHDIQSWKLPRLSGCLVCMPQAQIPSILRLLFHFSRHYILVSPLTLYAKDESQRPTDQMSTFDGIVKEFPDIRIDYFRSSNEQSRPPLALFLSHVHSDHLVGLESCKSPFIYCSPATRELLLRLEKYPHRMNFAKGILESRKQTYRHLKSLVRSVLAA